MYFSDLFCVALGGNMPSEVGNPAKTINFSFELMASKGISVCRKSRLFQTPCFPVGGGPDYVNAAAVIQTDMPAQKLLGVLHEIEQSMGRKRVTRWGQRTLDLDLLAMGNAVLPNEETFQEWFDLEIEEQAKIAPQELVLPHPRLHERAFVLIPLNDVASEWVHPVLGLSVAEMCRNLPEKERSEVKPL